jgi:hypothetical protein
MYLRLDKRRKPETKQMTVKELRTLKPDKEGPGISSGEDSGLTSGYGKFEDINCGDS